MLKNKSEEEGTHAVYKIVIVGDAAVGKTNLLASFVASQELKKKEEGSGENVGNSNSQNRLAIGYSEKHQPTIGCEFYSTVITHPTDGSRIQLQIWDTAGQERYRAITPGHFRRAVGALLVYDVTSKKSFESVLNYWYQELSEWPLSDCIMLVGNKVDLLQQGSVDPEKVVTLEEHNQAARDLMLRGSSRTSAKTGENVSEAFMRLVFLVHEQTKLKKKTQEGLNSNGEYDSSVSLNYLKNALALPEDSANDRSNNKGCECG